MFVLELSDVDLSLSDHFAGQSQSLVESLEPLARPSPPSERQFDLVLAEDHQSDLREHQQSSPVPSTPSGTGQAELSTGEQPIRADQWRSSRSAPTISEWNRDRRSKSLPFAPPETFSLLVRSLGHGIGTLVQRQEEVLREWFQRIRTEAET